METKKAKFGGGGEFPFDEVVFKVDMPDVYWVYYKKVHRDPKAEIDETTKSKIKGDWKFFVKVPRHPDEAKKDDEKIHISAPKMISINDNRLNVLLFASGPSRDYQFVRVMLAREVEANRASMSIYLQASKGLDEVQQDVDNSRLLPDFPTKLERPKSGKDGDKGELQGDPMNLKSYDVIIAFDPDWRDLKDYQLKLVKDWVEGDHGGGLIFVAGPQNTQRLIPPMPEKMNTWDLKSIFALFPVILARPLPNLTGDSMHDTTIPYFLKFTGIAKGFDFLKLDDESPLPLGGWDKFFGKLVQEDFPGGVSKTHPERGFYNYHLVQKAKPGAEILATFDDPKSPKTEDGKEQPYFVSMRAGKGKTFYIGSGEMWRLRTFNEEYHQRFWMKLARYTSAVSGGKSFGRFSMAAEFVTGAVPIEAEVMDKDGYPQSENAPPIVIIRRVNGKEIKPGQDSIPLVLKAKQTRGAVKGIFTGTAQIEDEGVYVAQIDIAGTKESIKQTFDVRRPDIELTDLRTDFPKLYNMATDAPAVLLAKMTEEGREHLEHGRDRPEGGGDVKFQGSPSARMFYRLRSAELASQCVMRVPPEKDRINGNLKNIWDAGPQVFNARQWADVPGLAITMFVLPAMVLGIVVALMLVGGRWPAALGVAGALAAIELGMWWVVANTCLPVEVLPALPVRRATGSADLELVDRHGHPVDSGALPVGAHLTRDHGPVYPGSSPG